MPISAVLRNAVPTALLIFLAFTMQGCNYTAPARDAPAAYTAGAATLIARLTQEAGNTAVAHQTRTARPTGQSGPPVKQVASPTLPPPPSNTPPPTDTPIPIPPTETPAPSATVTQPGAPCNQAEFLGDVTAPPDVIVPAGALLSKVWRVRNTGACTWGAGYALVLQSGNLITAAANSLPAVVAPGQVVDLSVALTVPGYAGVFQATWLLRSDGGQLFGVGRDGSAPLFARIQALQPTPIASASYDFTQNYCSLTWRSDAGGLPCPGTPQDANGGVALVQSPALESRRAGEPGLWVRPNRSAGGWISGRTPMLLIRSGDHFISEIGCLSDSPNCDLLFEFEYATSDGVLGRLGQWRETADGRTTLVDLDLSALAGRSATLTLSVYNRGAARDANGVWVLPRVQTGGAPRTAALIWTREGSPNTASCDELHILRTGTNSALAIAYDCRGTRFELGRALLTTTQLDQLNAWEEQLDDFEGEMYAASGGRPVTTWLSFRGLGDEIAGEPHIQALSNFAAQIFSQIVR